MSEEEMHRKVQLLYAKMRSTYSEEEVLSMLTSFDKIRHILGPMGFFMPILDDKFVTLGEIESDPRDPTKIGSEQNKRLKFLLEEYEKALPIIELGLGLI